MNLTPNSAAFSRFESIIIEMWILYLRLYYVRCLISFWECFWREFDFLRLACFWPISINTKIAYMFYTFRYHKSKYITKVICRRKLLQEYNFGMNVSKIWTNLLSLKVKISFTASTINTIYLIMKNRQHGRKFFCESESYRNTKYVNDLSSMMDNSYTRRQIWAFSLAYLPYLRSIESHCRTWGAAEMALQCLVASSQRQE